MSFKAAWTRVRTRLSTRLATMRRARTRTRVGRRTSGVPVFQPRAHYMPTFDLTIISANHQPCSTKIILY